MGTNKEASYTKVYEKLLPEWSDRNTGKLSDYTHGSHYKAFWKCCNGHEWQAMVKSRYDGYGCPFCSGRYPVKGINDLATLRPDLAAQWHPTKNNDLKPSDVSCNSNRRIWWKCAAGHEWEAPVSRRTEGKGCPYCHHKAVLPETGNDVFGSETGYNLKEVYPEIAAEWDYDKNQKNPEEYLPHSNKIVWWKCRKGHEWSANIGSRTRNNRPNRCPYCSGKRAIAGETDLVTTDPEVAAEWDYDRNKLSPTEITRSSNRKVFWVCRFGHVYKAIVANRTHGKGCPVCMGKSIGSSYKKDMI